MLRADEERPGRDWDLTASCEKSASAAQDLVQTRLPPRDRIVVIESNGFLRDCLYRSIADQWPGDAAACASLAELAEIAVDRRAMVVILSIVSLSDEEAASEFSKLMELNPPVRSMVLARADDINEALAALGQGANGYISMSAGFDIFVQAVRFVGAGGTYVPAQCLLAARQAPAALPEQVSASGVTARELAVIQAIRQGKPNKVIAYELNMCESTVKVHVRHIMKKLRAKNRTDVAIKGAEILSASARAETRDVSLSKGARASDRRSTTI